jgi:hypothetical protein
MLNILSSSYTSPPPIPISLSSEFKRKNEFRRICETLRLHQQQSSIRSNAAAAIVAGMNQPVTVDPWTRTLETRHYQFKIAVELGLWSVAFYTVEEIHTLLMKKRPSVPQLIAYYRALSKVLWMSANSDQHQFFHSAALMKLFSLLVSSGDETRGSVADQLVLAVLTCSVAESVPVAASEHTGNVGDESGLSAAEKSARLTTIVGCTGVPSYQSLMSDLVSKDVLVYCSEGVRRMHAIATEDTSRKATGWINTQFESVVSSLDPTLVDQFGLSLRRLVIVKVTREMQAMYSRVRFEKLEALTSSILPLADSIKLLGQLNRTEQIDVSVDYASRTISFGTTSNPSASSGVRAVTEAVASIRSVARRIRAPLLEAKMSEIAAEMLFDEENLAAAIEAERTKCVNRRDATECRKDTLEKEAIQRANDIADQIQKAEEERLEADARTRAEEVSRKEYEAHKRQDVLFKAKQIIDRVKSLPATCGDQIIVDLLKMNDDQVFALGLAKLEAIQKEQFAKEKEIRVAKRRNESKRIEHTSRAIRLAENEKINEWAQTVYDTDKSFFEQIASEKAEEWRKANEAKRSSINALVPFASVIGSWKSGKLDEFNHKLALKVEEKRMKSGTDTPDSSVSNHNITRDEFKEMAKSLPNWKEDQE